MSINEAISVLQRLTDGDYPKYTEALEMGIKALNSLKKIRKIFKSNSISNKWEYIHDLQIWEDALNIVDKELMEISDEYG